MAEKRLWWLKLKNDFFRRKVMKKLRSMERGEFYTIVYLKMQLASLQNGGVIVFEGVWDSPEEEIAEEIGEAVEDVRSTMAFLEQHGLLVRLSAEESFLPEAVENSGSESTSAKRVRALRERKMSEALQCNANVTLE